MPDTTKLSKYIKVENVQDGDTIVFIDGGVILEKDFKKDGVTEKRNVLEITVNFKGEHKTYSPNSTSVKLLSAAWGADSDGWVERQATLFVLPANNGKNMIVAKPAPEKKASVKDIIKDRNKAEGKEGSEETVPF